MTIPVYDNQVVGQGLARLTGAYITKPNIRAMLAVYMQPLQDLEDAVFKVMGDRILRTAQVYSGTVSIPGTDNVVFDYLGALVGVARAGVGDLALKTLIYLEVAVNRATGKTSDWGKFFSILEPFTSGTVVYLDGDAAFYYGLWDLQLDPNAVGTALRKAMPNGVGGEFAYTVWPDGNDLEWGSRYSSSAGQGTWGSRYDSSVGGLWVAGIDLGPGLSPLFASEI